MFQKLFTFRPSLLVIFAAATILQGGVALGEPPVKAVDNGSKTTDAKKEGGKAAEKKGSEFTTKWRTLKGKWEKCSFGGDGEITIKDELITMDYGDPITGVRWSGPILRENYEVEVEARRVEGFDFFVALTFPVGKKGRASLVLGGWGGGTMGISSIDDRDASDNETTMFREFENEKWYKARVRVEESRLAVFVDDKLMFDHPRKDHKFDIRYEMDPCLPLGLANFQCKSEIKNVRVRALAREELGADLEPKKKAEKAKADSK